VAGRPPAIARLVPAALRIALAPAAPFARVRVAHLHAVGLPPLEVPPRHHHAGAPRPLSHHETMSGTAGVEDARTATQRHAEDVSAPRHHLGGALPLEAPTTYVADAVQAHVTPEKAAHCPASGRRLLPVGNGANGIGVRTGAEVGEAGAGVWRTGGALRKGRLAEQQKPHEEPESADATTKVTAEDAISVPQMVLRPE
jgi:hypothetical protein